ncbi:MAG: SusE domain-containing protein [Chitinophagaceae bacterium]|nr:SusE domain-containing protein [Chitinophagaceae bacterium]
MKNIKKFLSITAVLVLVVTACRKVEDLPYYEEGKSVELSADKTAIAPTPADSITNVITFSWTNPEYKQDTGLYKYILEMDSTGRNFAKEATKIVVGSRSVSLTGKELNAILLNYGFALGVSKVLDFRITSSYGNNNERYLSNVVKVTVTPYNDPSVLTTANTSVTCALATANQLSNTFNWSTSFNGYAGNVTYVLQYDSATKNFATPHEIPVGVSLYTKALTQGEMNETALDEGVPGGNTGKIEYRIKATTAQGAISYSNTVSVTIASYIPLLRFYMPGGYQAATGNGGNWDPGTAPEFVRDLRPAALNKLYYMYIYLPANAEFKVTQGRSWDINYGGSGGNLASGGANLTVATAGFYRISIDRVNMKYDIREGRMGFVGGATGAGWTPANVFPTYAMGNSATNLFVGLTDFATGGWKLIDHNDWNNGDITVTNARSYGSAGGSGSSMLVNDANMPDIATAGRYRVIWDGRNVDNIKYEMSPATEMRVVGNGVQGVPDWDPASSPQMTYAGNGVWTLTVNLVGSREIKFLAGNAWGAFDYEDNGDAGVANTRKIKWEGGSNFATPATSGSYTITLDEKAQTVRIQ